MSRPIVLTLGRDSMGPSADEESFVRWIDYVSERIDEIAGVPVSVEARDASDVQSNDISGGDGDDDRDLLERAIEVLWDRWCRDGAP
jgi:hypothetical protein